MINKKYLLFIACIVWCIAGFNVLRIGFTAYINYQSIRNYLLSVVVFIPFCLMFLKLTQKHTLRINGYAEDKQWFFKFFDTKSFIIMAVMMGGGIIIRKFNLLPDQFIAIFYSGLGSALLLAGIVFGINFYKACK